MLIDDSIGTPVPLATEPLVDRGPRIRHFGARRWPVWVALLAIVAAVWYLYHSGFLTPEGITRYVESHRASAIPTFVLGYAVCVLSGVPTLPLNLAARLFWGALLGGVVSAFGAGSGAVAAFFVARYLAGQPLARSSESRVLAWLQRELASRGWRLIAVLRLTSMIPTGPLNYLLGLTSIRAGTYVWSTIVFLLPPSVAVAAAGSGMRPFLFSSRCGATLRALLGLCLAVAILVAIRYIARFFRRRPGS